MVCSQVKAPVATESGGNEPAVIGRGVRGRGGEGEGEALKRAVSLGTKFIVESTVVENSFSKVYRVDNSLAPNSMPVGDIECIENRRGLRYAASRVSPSRACSG